MTSTEFTDAQQLETTGYLISFCIPFKNTYFRNGTVFLRLHAQGMQIRKGLASVSSRLCKMITDRFSFQSLVLSNWPMTKAVCIQFLNFIGLYLFIFFCHVGLSEGLVSL